MAAERRFVMGKAVFGFYPALDEIEDDARQATLRHLAKVIDINSAIEVQSTSQVRRSETQPSARIGNFL